MFLLKYRNVIVTYLRGHAPRYKQLSDNSTNASRPKIYNPMSAHSPLLFIRAISAEFLRKEPIN